MGVASAELTPVMGEVLRILGCKRALVVHGADGLDELSLSGETRVVEVSANGRTSFVIHPEQLGFNRSTVSALSGGSATDNAEIAEAVLGGERGPRRDVVVLNAAATLYAAGKVRDLRAGVQAAADSIDSGAAAAKLEGLRHLSRSLQQKRLGLVS
jgi:anthranilate phosphoribosyltransferase